MESKSHRRRSSLWNSFTLVDNKLASCHYCEQTFSHKTSISNLKQHLKRKHPFVLKSDKDQVIQVVTPVETTSISDDSYTLLYVVSDDESKSSMTQVQESELPTHVVKQAEQPLPEIAPLEDSEENDEGQSTMKRSTTWRYFTQKKKGTAQCNFCRKVLSYKTSISNLKKHYQKKHRSNGKPTLKVKPASSSSNTTVHSTNINGGNHIQSAHASVGRKTRPNASSSKYDDQLIKMFTVHLLPISMVEGLGFQGFCRSLNSSYALPTKKKLTTELIPAKFEELTVKVREIMAKVRSVTLTTDCWTSYSNESFTRVVGHFINEDFESKSILLSVMACDWPVSDKFLGELLEQVVQEWELNEKVLIVISDNITDRQEEELQWPHIKCLASTIDSIVQESLKPVETFLSTLSKIVSLFNENVEAQEKLTFFQKKNNKESDNLTQRSPEQWNSVLYMLKSIKHYKEEIDESLRALDEPVLSDEDFQIVEELIQILDPIESVTKVTNKNITLSLIIVLSNSLLDHYNSLKKETSFSSEIEPVVTKLVDHLNERFWNLESVHTLLISTLLDPRFKHIGFSDHTFVHKAKLLVEDNLNLLYGDTTEKSKSVALDSEPLLIWNSFDKKVADTSVSLGKSKAITELDRYLEEPLLNRNEDPLQWWKVNAYNFPCLSNFIKMKFGPIASAISCKGSPTLIERRNTLTCKRINEIMFIGQNFDVGEG
ncbi:zinc finger BED domain-containing protein 1-like [Photinus pyralis]|uniref:zinc finger BED domain-containing protein 1-like n=1 Tax=Photinus pyralis TaxID=7054 RepID=UPI001267487A|nr:zinc finger BED domain-containing protein 1-like [Photinus pyralis]